MSQALYNENEPYAAEWLKNLIAAGHVAPGRVDSRSITELKAADFEGITQAHFFAGIGIWSYALRQAGWPDALPIWSGSCPCQPFSSAGRRKGTPEQFLARKERARAKGKQLGVSLTSLALQAQLVASPRATPAARDWRDGRASEATMKRNARPLNEQATMLVSPAPSTASGPTPSGSPAVTEKPGRLNPALSAWLQGIPPQWDACAPTEMPSARRRRKPSVGR